MADRIFEVELVITKKVRVRVPDYVKDHAPYTSDEESAEEFALGGKATWNQFVIREDVDCDVESVREIAAETA